MNIDRISAAASATKSRKGMEDLVLVRRSLGGDREAQEELAERLSCLAGILRHRNRRLSSPLAEADFQDLVQDTALALWRKLDRFDGRASLETWAYRFCTFQMMSSLRDFKRKPTLVLSLESGRLRLLSKSADRREPSKG